MKRKWMIVMLSLVVGASWRAASAHDQDGDEHAPGACRADAEKFCPGMHPGDGKFGPCMKEHKDELSQGCKDFMAGMMKHKSGDKAALACKEDTESYCPGMHPGDGNWGPCMKEHEDVLSGACKRMFARKDKIQDKVAQACQSDTDKFCPGMHPGDGKWGPCMKEHKDAMSPSCKEIFARAQQWKKKHFKGKEKESDGGQGGDDD